jgi:uncharacterized protein with PIN domain
VILGEPGSEDLVAYLEHALVQLMPAAIRVELGIVIETRLWPAGQDTADRFFATRGSTSSPSMRNWRPAR